MDLIGTIIFIVVVISSIAAQMMKESKKGPVKRPQGQKPLTRDMLPEATRRKLYGDGGTGPQVARPKQAQPKTAPPVRRAAPPRREESLAPGRQLLDALSGRTQSPEEEEEWTPAQPAPRRELPHAVQPPPPPPLPQERVAQQPPQEPPRVAARHEQAPRRRRERSSHRTAQVRQVKPQSQRVPRRSRQAPAKRTEPAALHRRGPSGILFSGLDDVRKAIVFAEILGPPKSME